MPNSNKPPRRDWKASERFIDLRLSHWVEIALTVALIFVGSSQLVVYNRQARIMAKQAEISDKQLVEMTAARHQQISSERARFSPSGYDLIKKGDTDPNPIVDYGFVNVGRSPGVVMEVSTVCLILDMKNPIFPVYDLANLSTANIAVTAGAVIGTKTKPEFLPVCKFDHPISASDYAAMENEMAYPLIVGFIRFRDIYETVYTQHFAAIFKNDGAFHDVLNPPGYNTETEEATR